MIDTVLASFLRTDEKNDHDFKCSDEPDPLFPEFLCENYCPHGLFAIVKLDITGWTSIPEFSFVPDDFTTYTSLHHAKKHSLNSLIQFVVTCTEICGTNIREDGFTDR